MRRDESKWMMHGSGSEGAASLRSTFMNLPRRERLAVTLQQMEGLDASTIATVLGISSGEARCALARGYSRIQRSWSNGRGARG